MNMDIFVNMLAQVHLLIGGMTGAGKSVVIRGILWALLQHHPARRKMVLIDPKRVELHPYRKAPHCISYADTPDTMADAIARMVEEMDKRYATMQAHEQRETTEPHIYIIIDEMADLMDVCGTETKTNLKRILQLGRAAGIHVIAATQHPERRVLPAEIQLNFTAVLALPCKTAIESRQLIGQTGAEKIEIGTAFYTSCSQRTPSRVSIPMVTDDELKNALDRWVKSAPASRHAPVAPIVQPAPAYITPSAPIQAQKPRRRSFSDFVKYVVFGR